VEISVNYYSAASCGIYVPVENLSAVNQVTQRRNPSVGWGSSLSPFKEYQVDTNYYAIYISF
jgi:hypothetical protein